VVGRLVRLHQQRVCLSRRSDGQQRISASSFCSASFHFTSISRLYRPTTGWCCPFVYAGCPMSKKSASPAPRLRSSEDKLYQSCLQACIEGIENLPVDKRQVSCTCKSFLLHSVRLPVADYRFLSLSATPTTTPLLNPAVTTDDTPVERAVTPPHQLEPASLLLSPPVTPQRESSVTRIHSPASDGTMNRTPLHGAPVRGQVVPPRDPPHPMLSTYGNQDARGVASSFGNQDARGNLAVQPAANAGTFKFKKNAVKIVSAPTPSSPFCAPSAPSPAPGPVKATPREVDRYVASAPPSCTA
jgi:hypothetical protein